jgi:hypothetical protein
MTRFVYTPLHSKPWFVLLLLAALLLPVCVQAELRAALSAQIIDELDSVQLVVRDIGTRQSETPDLSGLERDFHVLGVNTSSQYRFVNGQAQSWVDYQITLQPKRTGELIIPPIGIGQQRTDSMPISVRALSADMRRKIDALVFYEMELSSDSVYVQSQLLLTRRLVYADGVQLYGGQLETPVLDGAQVFALGEGQSSVIQRNGRTMGSYEQRYAIFPEQSGTLTLPSDAVTASVRVVDGNIYRAQNRAYQYPRAADRGASDSTGIPRRSAVAARYRGHCIGGFRTLSGSDGKRWGHHRQDPDGHRYWQYRHQCAPNRAVTQ